ncbi:MAG: hypothetical protein KGN02_08095, partial [bacterium]|nr:hypothetical protein [bacterium]
MHYAPVVDRFPIVPALDPLALALFAATFVAAALLTMRRAAYGAAALAFVLPFACAHAVGATTISLPKIVLLGVATGLLGTRAPLAALRDRPARAMALAFAVLCAAVLATTAVAAYRGEALREGAKWLEYALLFVTAACAYRSDPDAKLLRRAFALSVAAVCASALVQEVIGAPWGIVFAPGLAPRISGALEGPNQLAGYLEIALAMLAAWSVAAPSRARAALLAVAATTLALTFSRAGIA